MAYINDLIYTKKQKAEGVEIIKKFESFLCIGENFRTGARWILAILDITKIVLIQAKKNNFLILGLMWIAKNDFCL